MGYDLEAMKAPRAAGTMLRVFVTAVENAATGPLLADKLLGDAGILALRSRPVHAALDARHPVLEHDEARAVPAAVDLQALVARLRRPPARGFAQESIADFAAAYRSGRTSPVAVAERFTAHVAASEAREPAMRFFIAQERDDLLRQAEASQARFARGEPLGPLDGVPVAVKDELDQQGYATTVGTRFLGADGPASADAEVVARLRAAGALLVGKANMHEIGLGVTGLNPHHGAARNPHDPARATGGSSSGSAAIVGAGLCPLAVGADGGGSIRIPAALCGVYGLKATFGRVSEFGAAELCWSVAHVGPIAGTARDLALGYAIMAGPDDKDATSLLAPSVDLSGIERADLRGVKLGIYRPWFEDAEPAMVERSRELVEGLSAAGAELVDVELPELAVMRTVHLVTIVSEMVTAHLAHHRAHRSEYGLDTRLNLALGRRMSAFDYVHAQRHRARLLRLYREALAGVDALVTPATGCTAPLLPPDALATGESNLTVTDRIMRFAAFANLTGQPAVSIPAGYDDAGLPVGLQIMAPAWRESLLLRLALVCEGLVERREPHVSYRYLED